MPFKYLVIKIHDQDTRISREHVDLDQNGYITMEELRTVLQATGDHPTDEDALEMIAEADIDGDGRSKIENMNIVSQIYEIKCFS